MSAGAGHATTAFVTTGAGTIGNAAQAWQSVRADDRIQYAPVDLPQRPPPELPAWLEALFQWLGKLLGPLGEAFGSGWPVVKWVLLALAIAALAFLVWRLAGDSLGWRPRRSVEDDADWVPDSGAVLALLEDADRLAAEGRFAEATHLLLRRSVGQIAAARPEWVEPATTARELAAFDPLPEAARTAFGVIAERVERSLFALRALGEDDWQTARRAYADFALAKLPA